MQKQGCAAVKQTVEGRGTLFGLVCPRYMVIRNGGAQAQQDAALGTKHAAADVTAAATAADAVCCRACVSIVAFPTLGMRMAGAESVE